MEFSDTTALEKIENMHSRVNIIQGGTSAGKTIAILIMLIDLSFSEKDKTISVCSDSMPNLRRGAEKDFKKILHSTNRTVYFSENKSTHTFTNIITNSVIEFVSTDESGALGARRDYLFVNEANRISFETFNQLSIRTFNRIWLDFNPINEFWVHTELMARQNEWEFLKLTFLDNEALPETIRNSILDRKGDGTNNWWRVYGLGEIGTLEGNVYSGWTSINHLPKSYTLKRVGVDFGFANDPTAVVAVYENSEGHILVDEIIYQNKLLTSQLIKELKEWVDNHNTDPTFVCDNARPEIIAEMCSCDLNAIPCVKGVGSIKDGIEKVQERRVFYTSRSKNIEKEYLTYAWRVQRGTNRTLDVPVDENNHAMDAIRYAVRDMSILEPNYNIRVL